MQLQKTLSRAIQQSAFGFALGVISIGVNFKPLFAAELNPVTGVAFSNNTILWQSQDGATGYNIYLGFNYLTTVRDTTAFTPRANGDYHILAFDDNGNFGALNTTPVITVNPITDSDTTNANNSPLIPENVSGLTYSNTAGEIFWDRNLTQELTYTITLNGVQLGSTNGTSFWLESLPADTINVVTLQASGSTAAVSLHYDTNGSRYPSPAMLVDTQIEQPADNKPPTSLIEAPQNARIQIYGVTTAELFWDRAPTSQRIVSTDVYRDGVFIGSSPGNSFYDNTRLPNTRYAYELIAIDANNNPSDSAFINAGPFDAVAETIASAFLQGITDVTSANPHIDWYPEFEFIALGYTPEDIIEISSQTVNSTTQRTVYDCDGGSLILDTNRPDAALADATYTMQFNECETNIAQYDGTVVYSTSGGGLVKLIEYEDIEITGAIISYLSGMVSTALSEDGQIQTVTYKDFDYFTFGEFTDDDEELETAVVLNQTIEYAANQPTQPNTLTTSFVAIAHWTQGREIRVTTNELFATGNTSEINYTRGSLTAEANNGEQLVLSASTGDVDTWLVDVITTTDVTTISGEWSESIQLPMISNN